MSLPIAEIIRELSGRSPAPVTRANLGAWVQPAWVVRGLVEMHQYGVSQAVRKVVSEMKLQPLATAEKSVRAQYYRVRKQEWPVDPIS